MENIKGIKIDRFLNTDKQDVIKVITPDGNHWYYIDGEWILHN